ncbi:hypothetical protein TSUD_389530 [Trifolium subterraneum]|uniref:Uncharacterized protein n=1 Tax=Trifolium subterraneum TaxID=3900 RepID=A0A2Z6NDF4_TRISU|nr:hypothetical protein TSUD_389530 [Trifolium subterraneum]
MSKLQDGRLIEVAEGASGDGKGQWGVGDGKEHSCCPLIKNQYEGNVMDMAMLLCNVNCKCNKCEN